MSGKSCFITNGAFGDTLQCSEVSYIAVHCSAIQLSVVYKRLCYNWEMNGDSHETKAAERGDTGAVVETVKSAEHWYCEVLLLWRLVLWPLYGKVGFFEVHTVM